MSTFIKSDVVIDPAAVVGDYYRIPNAVIDFNFETERFWYSNTLYGSVAAVIAAGNGNSTGGVQRVNLPELPSAFSFYAKAVNGTPAAAYVMSLEGGSDGVAADNIVYLAQSLLSQFGCGVFAGSVDQTSSNLLTEGLGAGGLTVTAACRMKVNDLAASFNGAAVKTDTVASLPTGLTTLVIGNRDDGARPWSGTIQRIVIIAAELSDAELVALNL